MDAPRGLAQKPEPVVLAQAQSFALSALHVHPSRLIVVGPDGEVPVEPRVMQVLLALHEAGTATVSRDALMARCWPGVTVGDDSLNRAIAELRRVLRHAGANCTVETVPKVGYRLDNPDSVAETYAAATHLPSRRALLVGSGAVVAALGIVGTIWLTERGSRRDPALDSWLAESRQALREQLPDRNRLALRQLEKADSLSPDNPEVLGLLALAWRDAAEFDSERDAADAARLCETTARRALAIKPNEANALSALATLQPFYGDWRGAEKRILAVLDKAPDALPAISHLTSLYQSAGYLGESRAWNDKALQVDPLSPVFQFRGALKHWFDGDMSAADAQIDRALELWPRHPAVWNTRLMLYAYTGRAAAGLQFANNASMRPAIVPPRIVSLWQDVLTSLTGDRGARASARESAISAAMSGVSGVHTALMYLAYAHELDAAYEVANGFFLRRGPLAASGQAQPKIPWVTDQSWRRSMMLFTPPMAEFQDDPRFGALADGMGLTEFWKVRGKRPDYKAHIGPPRPLQ